MSEKSSETQIKPEKSQYKPVIGIAIISLLIGGLFFPLLVTAVGQALFPYQANGSLVHLDGRTVGSYYIDNGFTLPQFFHCRNESNPLNASASGLDPDITMQQAYSQVPRISNATGISSSALLNIVNGNTEGKYWILGTPYVNVLNLNIILIKQYPSVYTNFTSAST